MTAQDSVEGAPNPFLKDITWRPWQNPSSLTKECHNYDVMFISYPTPCAC